MQLQFYNTGHVPGVRAPLLQKSGQAMLPFLWPCQNPSYIFFLSLTDCEAEANYNL